MRGDRPVASEGRNYAQEATPHARGSTFDDGRYVSPEKGYPACAGIDLSFGAGVAVQHRLPRMRGDRPRRGTPVSL